MATRDVGSEPWQVVVVGGSSYWLAYIWKCSPNLRVLGSHSKRTSPNLRQLAPSTHGKMSPPVQDGAPQSSFEVPQPSTFSAPSLDISYERITMQKVVTRTRKTTALGCQWSFYFPTLGHCKVNHIRYAVQR